jgi:hypothetical protein
MRSRLPRICWICELIGPHCGDNAGEQRKKSAALAAGLVGLRDGAVEVGLLLGDRIFAALDLVGARRVGMPPWLRPRQLAFEAHAGRIGSRLIRRRAGLARLASAG